MENPLEDIDKTRDLHGDQIQIHFPAKKTGIKKGKRASEKRGQAQPTSAEQEDQFGSVAFGNWREPKHGVSSMAFATGPDYRLVGCQ